MITSRVDPGAFPATSETAEVQQELQYQTWKHWPVNWTATWVGALAAISAVLIFGLIAIALGAHLLGPENRVVDLRKVGIWTLVFSVFAAFLSYVIGGWVSGKVAGILHSEPAMLHGAIVWLVSVPLLLVLIALGAGNYFGGWYAGLAGSPTWASSGGTAAPFERPEPPAANASAEEVNQYRQEMANYQQKMRQWKEDAPKVARNSALGAVTALLLGLVGSVIGGWMACGEPMNFTYYRTRRQNVMARS